MSENGSSFCKYIQKSKIVKMPNSFSIVNNLTTSNNALNTVYLFNKKNILYFRNITNKIMTPPPLSFLNIINSASMIKTVLTLRGL